jgi:succinate-semialdehyde dehydrogenase/glutarate-semialdehyde dehydrogenase
MSSSAGLAERLGLADHALLRTGCLVGGSWRDGEAGAPRIGVYNPATGALLCSVPNLGAAALGDAVAAASAAQASWAGTPPRQRSNILRRWHDLMVTHVDDLARIMTAEQGKPLAEARGEARSVRRAPLHCADEMCAPDCL